MKVSVVIPVDRPGEDSRRAIAAVLGQKTTAEFELILVTASDIIVPEDRRIRMINVPDRNPAVRRNLGAKEATGDVLAFVDDDAFADEGWIETATAYLEANPDAVVVGGPDPAPSDSTLGELISETLLATPFIGSGVLVHENRKGVRNVQAPFDLALVNLFVRTAAFRDAGGFDEKIGYVGEDTDLLNRLMGKGRVVYHSGTVVRHRRRSFPGPFLRQRWNYRKKTGAMLARRGSPYRSSLKVLLFLLAGFLFIVSVVLAPFLGASLLVFYSVMTLILALPITRLPFWMWPLIPLFFLVHHATYFFGLVYGLASEVWKGPSP